MEGTKSYWIALGISFYLPRIEHPVFGADSSVLFLSQCDVNFINSLVRGEDSIVSGRKLWQEVYNEEGMVTFE